MEPFKDTKCCSCGWGVDSCRIKPVAEELGHMILASFTAAKIKTDFVDTMVVDDEEGILFRWMR
jgi:hypothetical protein